MNPNEQPDHVIKVRTCHGWACTSALYAGVMRLHADLISAVMWGGKIGEQDYISWCIGWVISRASDIRDKKATTYKIPGELNVEVDAYGHFSTSAIGKVIWQTPALPVMNAIRQRIYRENIDSVKANLRYAVEQSMHIQTSRELTDSLYSHASNRLDEYVKTGNDRKLRALQQTTGIGDFANNSILDLVNDWYIHCPTKALIRAEIDDYIKELGWEEDATLAYGPMTDDVYAQLLYGYVVSLESSIMDIAMDLAMQGNMSVWDFHRDVSIALYINRQDTIIFERLYNTGGPRENIPCSLEEAKEKYEKEG